jgi:8-oxo-dGTP pyrophosphatase MutT (NUDIX family)
VPELDPPIPAATLIIMRPATGGGPPELLMMERTRDMVFAAGALVFPGGRIDPDDHRSAQLLGETREDAAARVAAIRETIEETGVAPGLASPIGPAALASARAHLSADRPLSTLIERGDLELDLAALTPFARWCPSFASLEEARADAQRHPVRTITPWVEERDGTKWVCIPEDIGYPVTAEPFETARRR